MWLACARPRAALLEIHVLLAVWIGDLPPSRQVPDTCVAVGQERTASHISRGNHVCGLWDRQSWLPILAASPLSGGLVFLRRCSWASLLACRARDPNAEPLHMRLKGRPLHPQQGGGSLRTGDDPVGLFERGQDLFSLGFLEHAAHRPGIFRRHEAV